MERTQTGGSASGAGSIVGGPCEATIREGDSFRVALERTMTVPDSLTVLELTLENVDFDLTESNSINDALEIAVLDRDGNSLVHRIDSQRASAINLTESLDPQTAVGSSFDGEKITIDLSGVPAGTEATVVVQLINNDQDVGTSVGLKRFEILPGAGQGVLSTVTNELERSSQSEINFETLTDVTPSLLTEFASTSFVQRTSILDAEIGVRNVGPFAVNGPIALVIDGLSDPTIRPVGFDGRTPDGHPYYLFDVESADGQLESLAATQQRSIRFENVPGEQFDFRHSVYASLNRAPEFTSLPDTEAIVGRSYAYRSEAVDPNVDTLQFELISGPAEMSIDASTGAVIWAPTSADLGNHEVIIAVSDGNGGSSEQAFTLAAIDPPPNRPPVVTSSPDVVAAVGEGYDYQLLADDVDGDVLTYSVVDGPANLSIDSMLGRLTWQPVGAQLGAASRQLTSQ